MNCGRRVALASVLAGLVLAAWMAFSLWLLASTLDASQRELLSGLLVPRAALLGIAWAIGTALLATAAHLLARRHIAAPQRLLEQARVALAAERAQALAAQGAAELQGFAEVFNALAAQRDSLRDEVEERIAEASRGVQQERNRLAALMSELTQGVVVCTLDGRVTLYNPRARQLLRDCSGAPGVCDGAELVGIGRSIHAVFDRELVAHGLEVIENQLARGEAMPSAQFVTTAGGGRLLRAQMAPVRQGGAEGERTILEGYVLLLDDVTRSFEEEDLRDRLLLGLAERQRASLAHLQDAVARLAAADGAGRAQAAQLAQAELHAMGERIQAAARQTGARPRWPMEEMLGADLLAAARRRMEALCSRPVTIAESGEGLWLRVESFTLIQALSYLAARLVEEFDVRALELRLRGEEDRARLDLVWSGDAVSNETVVSWESEPMRVGGQATALTVRDVLQRHGAQMEFERERRRHEAWFRFLLPLAGAPRRSVSARLPEAYDFSLLAAAPADARQEDTPLTALAYTVFDTETTGLDAQRDEIIQIGAVRIVNGRILAQEAFEQLVDPGRRIPAHTTAIHGITPQRVAGQPRIEQVLPTFHAYARDTVLVAHNAAFDMKLLQQLQGRTGLVFGQPVLDTLLLSAAVHPWQASHRLEAIAERFGLQVQGRHTALGDAMLTAEILLRLIPLLRDRGIHTLRQAREAAQKTWQSRLRY